MPTGIVVIMEVREGRVKRASLEALAEGIRLKAGTGGGVAAVIPGHGLDSAVRQVVESGADRIVLVEHEELAAYSTEAFRDALVPAIRAADPALILMGATVLGRDLAPALAAPNALDCGYAAECTELRAEGGRILAKRPVYAGKAVATVSTANPPLLASLRPNVFSAALPGGAAAPVERAGVSLSGSSPRCRVTETRASSKTGLDVAEADVVVSGGRGMGGPEGFAPLEKLAAALGGAVGASRAVVDLGWRPHSEQVGQTGKVVSPKLYIACGISGAIQHLAGMRTSKVIVAINKDPEAPIFKVADYGIVGDVQEVVPALTAAIEASR